MAWQHRQHAELGALGAEHQVLHFRFEFEELVDQIELLGSEVLPKFR
jgi:hypothetical protein